MAAMKTLTRTEPMKGLQVLIPASVHEVLRVEAARQDKSMGVLVAESVASFFDMPRKNAA
jgi:predicted HicB family RNase H-like nuclease